jgi:hypothetical protein
VLLNFSILVEYSAIFPSRYRIYGKIVPGRGICPIPAVRRRFFGLCEDIMTSPLDQKIRITGPVVVTANRVGDGAVVYRRADGGWSTELADAAVTTDAAIARGLINEANADELKAVGSYLAPVKLTDGGKLGPGNLRELIRHRGPTIELPVPLGAAPLRGQPALAMNERT